MSFEKDKGDEYFTKFRFKKSLQWYLKAQEILFTKGKEDDRRKVEIRIARCLSLLGRKNEAIQILEDLYHQTRDKLLFEENLSVVIELGATYFLYGDYKKGGEWLDKVDEEDISPERPKLYFRYWQIQAQLLIVYHKLDEAKDTVLELMDKAKEIGNDPYFHELQVLLAQIDAEDGDVLQAYSKIDKALKYFEETPFERSAFEKKIILSQFIEEPEKTISLIDDYIEKYQPEDIQPLALSAQRIELELRSGKIDPEEAIEKGKRVLASLESIEQKEMAAKIRRLLAGLSHSVSDILSAFKFYNSAKNYFLMQDMEYEEAVTAFVFLPAFLQQHSAKMLSSMENLFSRILPERSSYTEDLDVEEEMKRIKDVFQKYGDKVRAKMTQFFFLSYQISTANMDLDLKQAIKKIEDIHTYMVDKGEIHYAEMVGNFLELLNKYPNLK